MTIGVEAYVLRRNQGERVRVTASEFVLVAVDDHGVPRALPAEGVTASRLQQGERLVARGGAEGFAQVGIVGRAGEDHAADAEGDDGLGAAVGVAGVRQCRAIDVRHAADEVGVGLPAAMTGRRAATSAGSAYSGQCMSMSSSTSSLR